MSGVSDDFPVQLAMRLPDWLAGGMLQHIVLRICPCRSPNSTNPTCCGQVTSILIRHVRLPRDMLATHDSLSQLVNCTNDNSLVY